MHSYKYINKHMYPCVYVHAHGYSFIDIFLYIHVYVHVCAYNVSKDMHTYRYIYIYCVIIYVYTPKPDSSIFLLSGCVKMAFIAGLQGERGWLQRHTHISILQVYVRIHSDTFIYVDI